MRRPNVLHPSDRIHIRDKKVLLLYFVPATLYCLYNNLSFRSLSFFDPTSYFMFMQSRLLMTGVIYQVVFRRPSRIFLGWAVT